MDIISFNEAATANGRIEKFISNPDSNSGVVTVPKTIGAGESVTIPAGRMAVLPNIQVDGTLNIEGEVFIPTGSAIDMGNGLAINGEKVVMSIPTSYHLLQGNLAVDNTVITQGFSTTLYTGNGSTQSINTGIDMDTQWGDTAEEKFGGLVWIKNRNGTSADHRLIDTVRGATKSLSSSATYAEYVEANGLTAFNSNGFSVGALSALNTNTRLQSSWNFQTTHRRTGVTNHSKAYTEHYNPFTGFTIIKYEGSGIAGHVIPQSLGRKLGFTTIKQLNGANGWLSQYKEKSYLYLNSTVAEESNVDIVTSFNTVSSTLGSNIAINGATNQYIMYGWTNSYLDEANKLIGNYEIGIYQGTGAAGNKITTRGKPAWFMVKRLDSTGDWIVFDNQRIQARPLYPNISTVEGVNTSIVFEEDGLNNVVSSAGGQYLYMVVYDTNSDGGGSYYPKTSDTSNVQINNALIPIAKGSDINGLKNVMLSKNETITGLAYTSGKNYIYCDANGSYGVKPVAPNYSTTNPANGGDFYNILENKWYTSAGVEIPEGRNYLNHIVHADNDGGVLYVEELPKVEYKDVIKANEYQGKNACTAWAIIDGQTTPPTIIGSYGISSVIKTTPGKYELIPTEDFNNEFFSVTGTSGISTAEFKHLEVQTKNRIKVQIWSGSSYVDTIFSVQIFGGKN